MMSRNIKDSQPHVSGSILVMWAPGGCRWRGVSHQFFKKIKKFSDDKNQGGAGWDRTGMAGGGKGQGGTGGAPHDQN